MGITVTNEKGEDMTSFDPRAPYKVYRCVGCGGEVHAPSAIASHPVDDKQCGPLIFIRDGRLGETF